MAVNIAQRLAGGFPDILCHRNGEAFAFDLLYFQNYFQKWERKPRGKAEHLQSSFPSVYPNSPVSHKRSMTGVNKEESCFNSNVTLHVLKCINIEVIKNYR